jgi:hypothetical protein
MRRGLYRVHGIGGLADDVRVIDDGIELPLEENLYRSRGYLPLVEQLPWQEDYVLNSAPEPPGKADREQARQEFLARFRQP